MAGSITQEVFEAVLARPVVVRGGEHGALVHVWWRAPQQGDRLVQVYVDGELVEVTHSVSQREVWLMWDRDRPFRVELLAVGVSEAGGNPEEDPGGVWAAYPEMLASWQPAVQTAAKLMIVRDERLPIDTQMAVSVDGVVRDRGALWPADEHRGGFGALFGLGEFGQDAVTGLGLGAGELGLGALGADGTAWRWRRDDLGVGVHELTAAALDHAGQSVAGEVNVNGVVIEEQPRAAASFTFDTDFTLHWTG